jgi:rod shape-determining protein MreD
MKVFLLYFTIASFIVPVQAVFLKGLKPDLMLILVFFYSLRYGHIRGMLFGIVIGFILDIMSGYIIGANVMSKAVVGYFTSSIRQQIFQWNLVTYLIVFAFFSALDAFLVYINLQLFTDIAFENMSLQILIFQILLTIAVSIFVYPFFSHEVRGDLSIRS